MCVCVCERARACACVRVYVTLCVWGGGGGVRARAHTHFLARKFTCWGREGVYQSYTQNYTNPPPLELFNDANMCKGKQEGTLSSNAHFALT